ncbi:MAG: NUDIX domain-containing protein [Rhodospirillales bacterium]
MPTTDIPARDGVEIASNETVWSGRFPLQIVKFRHRRFDGAMSGLRTWELWRRGAAAAVLPYDPVTDHVVVIEQFRLPALAAGLDPMLVELPAGLADGTEQPEQVVRREALEEMGLAVQRLEFVGKFLLTPGGCDEHCSIFAGQVRLPSLPSDGLVGHGGLASEQEDIRVRAMPAGQAIEAAIAGAYPNSVTTIGLLWLAARRDWLRARWGDA